MHLFRLVLPLQGQFQSPFRLLLLLLGPSNREITGVPKLNGLPALELTGLQVPHVEQAV